MTTIQLTLSKAIEQLDASSESPQADAEFLLCHVLECSRAHLYTWPEQTLLQTQTDTFQSLLKRRLAGEPIAYLTGQRAFWEFELKVSAATLIPRTETELLVEQALLRIPDNKDCRVLDLGTGSGAIALAIASQRPACQIYAVEQSAEALTVARQNAQALGLANIHLLHGDWFSPVQDRGFDTIVSNPPYIAAADPHLQQGDVRHEPHSALVSGVDGLDDIRHIISHARQHLRPQGWLLLEHGYDQAEIIKSLFLKCNFIHPTQAEDLAGHIRVSSAQWPGPLHG